MHYLIVQSEGVWIILPSTEITKDEQILQTFVIVTPCGNWEIEKQLEFSGKVSINEQPITIYSGLLKLSGVSK